MTHPSTLWLKVLLNTCVGSSGEASGEAWKAWIASAAKRREAAGR